MLTPPLPLTIIHIVLTTIHTQKFLMLCASGSCNFCLKKVLHYAQIIKIVINLICDIWILRYFSWLLKTNTFKRRHNLEEICKSQIFSFKIRTEKKYVFLKKNFPWNDCFWELQLLYSLWGISFHVLRVSSLLQFPFMVLLIFLCVCQV